MAIRRTRRCTDRTAPVRPATKLKAWQEAFEPRAKPANPASDAPCKTRGFALGR